MLVPPVRAIGTGVRALSHESSSEVGVWDRLEFSRFLCSYGCLRGRPLFFFIAAGACSIGVGPVGSAGVGAVALLGSPNAGAGCFFRCSLRFFFSGSGSPSFGSCGAGAVSTMALCIVLVMRTRVTFVCPSGAG